MLSLLRLCLAALVTGAGGCADYLDRRDTTLPGAGEAVATNIITQQIDPWPAHARSRGGLSDGDRLQRAIERYRNPRTVGDAAVSQSGGQGAAPTPARAP